MSETSATTSRTEEQLLASQAEKRIWEIGADLRRAATAVEAIAARFAQAPEVYDGSYTHEASRVVRTIDTMLPNLGLGPMVLLAAQADVARAKGE